MHVTTAIIYADDFEVLQKVIKFAISSGFLNEIKTPEEMKKLSVTMELLGL